MELAEVDGEFRACVKFVSDLLPGLLARVAPENRMLLVALREASRRGFCGHASVTPSKHTRLQTCLLCSHGGLE